MEKGNSKKYIGFTDILKAKLIEAGTNYFKENITKTKKQVFKYVEKNIENKIKFEIKKNLFKLSSFILFGIGFSFLIYGIIEIIINLLFLPNFLINIFFAILIILIGFIFYINN